LTDFNQVWISLTDLHEGLQYEISMKFLQSEPRWCTHTDGETDMRSYLALFATVWTCLRVPCL